MIEPNSFELQSMTGLGGSPIPPYGTRYLEISSYFPKGKFPASHPLLFKNSSANIFLLAIRGEKPFEKMPDYLTIVMEFEFDEEDSLF